MANKTEGVRTLVQDVLRTRFQEPYGDDIILSVFKEIKNTREWEKQYKELSDELRHWVVNNWIGKYTKDLTGLKSGRHVPALDGFFIRSYTKLVP